MLPMQALRLALGTALAADPASLAPAALANKIALVMAPFTPTETMIATDLTYATFTGATPLGGVAGTQFTGIDPVTLQQVITVKPPVGGYRWVTGDTVNLPQAIYGFALLDTTLATLFGVQLFDNPISLNAAGQQIELPPVLLTFVQRPIS